MSFVQKPHNQNTTSKAASIHDDSFPIQNTQNEAVDPQSGLSRGLQTRHLSMMALAGIIGPGLLVGSGGALSSGGPASLLIGFAVIGLLAFSIMQSLGELTTLYPSSGSFISLTSRFYDPAFSVAVGWNYFIIWAAVLANEYNTLSSIFTFWSDALLGVTAFGEAEFWLALLKLGGLVAFFIFSIIYAAGGLPNQQHALGFQYWHNPGAFASGFRGVAKVFVFCSTFYAGCESIAVAAAETRNPRHAVPLAIRQVFWRILFIYIGSALFFGITCPWNTPGLASASSKALKSPMTIAIQNAGWEGGVHLINAFILATCISAVNSSIYIGSRTILFLAQDGKAPQFLGRTDSRGVPIPSIIFTNLFGALSLMNISSGAGAAYTYIVNLSGVSTFLVWGSISFIHIRFRSAWKAQGRSVSSLPFVSFGYPWNAYFGLGANVFLALVQGWTTLSPFVAGDFVDAYVLLPVFGLVWAGYKVVWKTRVARLEEIELDEGRRRDLDEVDRDGFDGLEEYEGSAKVKMPLWRRILRNF
ncbi:General amino acid permease [Clarireedia jacksonii]